MPPRSPRKNHATAKEGGKTPGTEPQPRRLRSRLNAKNLDGNASPSTASSHRRESASPVTLHSEAGSSNVASPGMSQRFRKRSRTEDYTPPPRSSVGPRLSPMFPRFHTEETVASTFQGAHSFRISGTPQFVNIGSQHNVTNHNGVYGVDIVIRSSRGNTDQHKGMDILKEFVSFSGLHDSSAQDPERRCHPGTREGVLKQMRDWIDDPHAPERIFWLHGPAGVGKSAIAQTICHSYGRDQVAATFFLFRSDIARNDGNRLLPTLAWQLAMSIPGADDLITQALTENPDLPRKSVEMQFEHLIRKPLEIIASGPSLPLRHSPVVIIDGLDECSDDKLQRRLIKIIRDTVDDNNVIPLRFLISSRPEAHIREGFNRIQCPTIQVDLADVEDAYRDIERYFTVEFTRIATERHRDPVAWPGKSVIDDFVLKSSGQFVYASTVIKFVGDDYSSAASQLDILLGLKPTEGKSPFATLDALYLEILHRQQDRKFVKDFLALLLSECEDSDHAMLLNTDTEGLHRKLRGMHSLLKFSQNGRGRNIDIYHRSFLDFIQDPSRSEQYHISKHGARKRYLQLIVDSLVHFAQNAIEPLACHGTDHFAPRFAPRIRTYPRERELTLSIPDIEEAMQPLLLMQDELLKLSSFSSPLRATLCNKCAAFYTFEDLLLHRAIFRGNLPPASSLSQHERNMIRPDFTVISIHSTLMCGRITLLSDSDAQSTSDTELDRCLSLLLVYLRNVEPGSPPDTALVDIVRLLLHFDYAEAASKIRSANDAQNLIDLIFYLINVGKWGEDAARTAALLALEIFARVPVLPQSLFLNGKDIRVDGYYGSQGTYHEKPVRIWRSFNTVGINPMCQTVFVWAMLSHDNISPLIGVYEQEDDVVQHDILVFVFQDAENGTLRDWRWKSNPPAAVIQKRMLEVAMALQYMRSIGIVIDFDLSGKCVYLDSDNRVKIPGLGLRLLYIDETPSQYMKLLKEKGYYTYENIVFLFGCLYYEIYFDIDIPNDFRDYPSRRNLSKLVTRNRPLEPEIDDREWELIQRCCDEDATSRPTIDDVVKEMESWD